MKYRIKNFLSRNECNEVISFYKNNINKKFTYGTTEPISILNNHNPFIQKCLNNINIKCSSLNKVYMDNAEIIKWLNGGFMKPHYDEGDEFAAIVYLNNDYSGGELVLDGNIIKPDLGELIIFNNGKILHSVNKVVGERYTLSTWFKII